MKRADTLNSDEEKIIDQLVITNRIAMKCWDEFNRRDNIRMEAWELSQSIN